MDTTKTKIKNKNYKILMPNTNSSTIKVQKRDGKLEVLDINKIHFNFGIESGNRGRVNERSFSS